MSATLQRNAEHYHECKSESVKMSEAYTGAKCSVSNYSVACLKH